MSTKRKAAAAIAKPVLRQSAKASTKSKIDESRTAVSTGLSQKPASKSSAEAISTRTDAASDYDTDNEEEAGSDSEEEPEEDDETSPAKPPRQTRSQDATDVDTVMHEAGDTSDGEPASPTFGDLVRSNSTIDVPAALAAQQQATSGAPTAQLPSRQRPTAAAAAPISATSLGTVLNQALRTDDADLLESCLQTTDVKIIENTINRMDSALAAVLLSKLSARMHRRPGRAFGLMRWMQWTLVAHGGALVTQPDLVARLSELSRVLEERARGLSSLLALKGKLDMLDSQMKFRKSVKVGGGGGGSVGRLRGGDEVESGDEGEDGEEEDVDEPEVVYVEGQEAPGKPLTNGTAAGRLDAGADEEDDFPAGSAEISDSDEESDEEFGGDMDEELAATESLDEDDVDYDDVEEEDEEEESAGEESRPPAKVRRTSERISKRK
ncbi:NUC189-domain-containing protein [Parathielavia hyrcaniae]|uniref:NUC189-domain-containing protein n=1 Tax=Parathielavia hyrcaniae TaxID=113614 RepID=A0AAN6PU23_9PEZI|nr:NUC189-domain-containing protein [Parathielavia hyrcaniae]